MAIKISDYTKTKHHGLRQLKLDKNHFLIDFTHLSKRYRKKIIAENIDNAHKQLSAFKDKTIYQLTITSDLDATVNDYWKIVIKNNNWNDKTRNDYENHYKNHIKRTLGSIIIRNIKPSTLTNFNRNFEKLTKRTHKKSYEILRPIIDLAMEDEIISQSPIRKSHVPKRNAMEEKKIITNAEQKYYEIHDAIINVFKDRPDLKVFFLFGFHGRRINEVRTLKWSDISFQNDTYLIRADNSKVNQDMLFTIPDEIGEELLLMSNGKINTNEDVFKVKEVGKHYKKIRKYSGISDFSYHWMRNLVVSALASQGVSVTHLSALLGHTDGLVLKKYLSMQRASSTKITNEISENLLRDMKTQAFLAEVAAANKKDKELAQNQLT